MRTSNTSVPRRFRLTSSALLLGLCALALPAACDSTPEVAGDGQSGGGSATCDNSSDCSDGRFCSSAGLCEKECATCGNACDVTSDCPDGQYCDSFQGCQAECTPGESGKAPCASDQICSENGKCIAETSIDVGIGGAGGGSGGGNTSCIKEEITFEPQTPNVVLLIDQSGSMTANNFGDSVDDAIDDGSYSSWDCGDDYDWRWNVVRNVLLHPDNGVVSPLGDRVRFGLALYSSEGGTAGGTCPALTEVDLAFDTRDAMLDEFDCSDLLTDTPTRESLTATAEQLAAADVDGPKVIVLATDGEPDNCTCPNWNADSGTTCASTDENQVMRGGESMSPAEAEQYDVIQEAKRIKEELGITVEVINVSNPNSTSLAEHLDQVAEVGGATSGASIPGFDPGALASAFQTIIDGVRSCAVDLNGEVANGKEGTGTVKLDGLTLGLNDDDGWRLNTSSQIELLGEACETIKTGDHDIDIDFPCDSFVVVTR